jgi:hypothetical protein
MDRDHPPINHRCAYQRFGSDLRAQTTDKKLDDGSDRKIVAVAGLDGHVEARNKIQKSTISIIDEVKLASPKGGTFIKYEDGGWWEVDDAFAREKIGGLLRDFLHMQYRSSTKAKLPEERAKVNLSRVAQMTTPLTVAATTTTASHHPNKKWNS